MIREIRSITQSLPNLVAQRLWVELKNWPTVQFIVRGDSGFCRRRLILEFAYGAKAWSCECMIVTHLEFGIQGNNPRLIVTNPDLPAADQNDLLYCSRGAAENRIIRCSSILASPEQSAPLCGRTTCRT